MQWCHLIAHGQVTGGWRFPYAWCVGGGCSGKCEKAPQGRPKRDKSATAGIESAIPKSPERHRTVPQTPPERHERHRTLKTLFLRTAMCPPTAFLCTCTAESTFLGHYTIIEAELQFIDWYMHDQVNPVIMQEVRIFLQRMRLQVLDLALDLGVNLDLGDMQEFFETVPLVADEPEEPIFSPVSPNATPGWYVTFEDDDY